MRVDDLSTYEPSGVGAVVTIGAYDGVHLGHQAVLRLVRELATGRRQEAVCLTFDRHPAEVVRPGSAPCLLTTLDQKLELLAATGYLDTTVVLAFDEARSRETAEDFVRDVLVARLGARLVVVGSDFHFGHRRHGTVRLLEQMGAELGFEVVGLGLVPVEGDAEATPYSSTEIRRLLADGRVAAAAAMLGRPPRPYELRGAVVTGDGRGRALDFPTANIALPARSCRPADGIYAGTFVAEDGAERPGAISIGRRPTFYEDAPESVLEVHVLDFDGDLIGQSVAVRFVERLRGEDRFDSVDALVRQMRRDVDATRAIVGR
ncbi:MAG TPA: bifunctional riboflavin kinase/FAD synthetase [Acidimicrobiia bacterium]|jgi:riboflavin kinase/FMN adenylyltransferase|nr:bifunctional riboflavin kinase/FAD synthetase [Acidimicrobiia bacterium]